MSLSDPRTVNPAVKFIEYKSDIGEFQYYDKETKQNVQLEMPLYFVVLDQLSAIKGFNQSLKVGIYSNEVRYIKDEVLNVRSFKGGVNIVGKYQDIKDAALREGGKYCKSVYAMLIKNKGEYELVNFQLHGASFSGAGDNSISGWVNLKANTEQYGIVVKEVEHGKIGAVEFTSPVFEISWKLTDKPDILQAATEMDKALQKYLKSYLSKQVEQEVSQSQELEPINENDPAGMGEFEAEQMGLTRKDKEPMDTTLPEGIDSLPF